MRSRPAIRGRVVLEGQLAFGQGGRIGEGLDWEPLGSATRLGY